MEESRLQNGRNPFAEWMKTLCRMEGNPFVEWNENPLLNGGKPFAEG
jgi:hypothetical protein